MQFMPTVLLDGPYTAPAMDFLEYDTVLMVGCGIGITPFASSLKSLHYRASHPGGMQRLQKLYVIWVCKTIQDFSWMAQLLDVAGRDPVLSEVVDIALYWTDGKADQAVTTRTNRKSIGEMLADDKTLSDLREKSFEGRPQWSTIFEALADLHHGQEVGTFFCGPPRLGAELRKLCRQHTKSPTRFTMHQEKF